MIQFSFWKSPFDMCDGLCVNLIVQQVSPFLVVIILVCEVR